MKNRLRTYRAVFGRFSGQNSYERFYKIENYKEIFYEDAIKHPEYHDKTMYDLGLIYLRNPYILGDESGIYAPCLDRVLDTVDDVTYKVAGFGGKEKKTSEKNLIRKNKGEQTISNYTIWVTTSVLQSASMNRTNDLLCDEEICYNCTNNPLMCVRHPESGVCEYDSGGAVLAENPANGLEYLVGILSVNLDMDRRKIFPINKTDFICGANSVGFANSLYYQLIWIKKHTGSELCTDIDCLPHYDNLQKRNVEKPKDVDYYANGIWVILINRLSE